ncbi:signal peptidase II [Metamycoplasma equirhinis]|uniref:signal peptidase II n=1 Tax=Metamycoplasma equirhinis TaxID=92402 RepID=UPI00359CA4B8
MNKTKKSIPFFTKEYWKKEWKSILINLAVYLGIFVGGILIDLLTKEFIFDKRAIDDSSKQYTIVSNSFIRFWSVFHRGTTLEIGLSKPGLHTVSILIILVTLFVSLMLHGKKYWWVIAGLALAASGSFGNMFDRFKFDGVRDIINFPWADYGTFNFADVWLVLGGIWIVISITVISIINYVQEKKQKTINNEVVKYTEEDNESHFSTN